MMKVRAQFQGLPILEIEGDPEEVAKLLLYLKNDDQVLVSTRLNDQVGNGSVDLTAQRNGHRKRPAMGPSRRSTTTTANRANQKPSRSEGSVESLLMARPYGGAPNRREMILYCFEELFSKGKPAVNLSAIRHSFGENFPDESLKNLDQVVRDLANKTAWVDSPSRGLYQLAHDYEKKYFPSK